ncbi:unnamed protein product [Oikopleura dioica]|uniref:Uncharacterized protein n=1 Tax=Oikopleura dioica TaxID=34765 RepID=E4XHZ8_OIKDI|nr:unnamed protein product [Oikopleura dioica]
MKLFSTIILLTATADARRQKKNKNRNDEVEETSGEGSGVAPVTAEEAVLVVDDLVNDLVAVADASGESTKALKRRVDHLKTLGALNAPDGACAAPYDTENFGGDDFATWAASVEATGDRCDDSTAIKTGMGAFLANYACTDGITSRKTKRWSRIVERLKNYCL